MPTGRQTALSFSTPKPTFTDTLKMIRRVTMLDIRVSFPATVAVVDPGGATVTVSPDITDMIDTEVGEQEHVSDIPNVPVLVYGQGATGGGYLQFPVRVGDKGLVVVNDRSLENWINEGLQAPPGGYHTHSSNDSFFLPGLRDKSRALTQDETATVLEDVLIKLGAGATEAAVLGNILDTYIKTIVVQLFNVHTHTTLVATVPVQSSPPLPQLTDPIGILSNKVKVGS